MSSPNNVFRKIDDSLERVRIFEDLAKSRELITCKAKGEEVYVFKPYLYTTNNVLVCVQGENSAFPKADKLDEVICSFMLNGEKYFIQSQIVRNKKEVNLTTSAELFLLQRRQAYRIRLPLSYKAGMEIQNYDGRELQAPALMMDLSSKGCRLVVPKKALQPELGKNLSGIMVIKDRENMMISGIIRHMTVDPQGNDNWSIGVEFNHLSQIVENKIFGITMDLHRELFMRWK